jgi:hypothetical protein
MANRINQLQQLSSQIPGMDQQTATANKAARTAILQRQLGLSPVSAASVQQANVQNAALAGQQQVEQAQQSQQTTAQLGQLALQQQAQVAEAQQQRAALSQQEAQQQAQQSLAARLQNEDIQSKKRTSAEDIASAQRLQAAGFDVDQKLQFATEKQRKDLANLGADVKAQLLDSRLAFEKDDRGRRFSNDRQLADYAVATAKSQEDLEAKLQTMQQAAQQKAMLLDAVNNRLLQIQKQGFINTQGDLDRASRERIAVLGAEARREAEKAAADAANKSAMWGAGGALLGSMAGAIIAGVATGGLGAGEGAMIGSQVGGAVGTGAQSQFGG